MGQERAWLISCGSRAGFLLAALTRWYCTNRVLVVLQAVEEVARSKHPERVAFAESYEQLEAKLKAQERRLSEQQKTQGRFEDTLRDLEQRTATFKQIKEEYRAVADLMKVRALSEMSLEQADGHGGRERGIGKADEGWARWPGLRCGPNGTVAIRTLLLTSGHAAVYSIWRQHVPCASFGWSVFGAIWSASLR